MTDLMLRKSKRRTASDRQQAGVGDAAGDGTPPYKQHPVGRGV